LAFAAFTATIMFTLSQLPEAIWFYMRDHGCIRNCCGPILFLCRRKSPTL